ncbi:MAG: Glu/Leu/Phe/Val family dehydrogenase [Marmoricola sp.]
MSTPASLLEITWTDPVTGRKGYVVIDRLVRGLASGGLRLREGCSLEEVRGLAQGMTRKESLVYDPADHYLPLGGGKGGIDVDPQDPQAVEVLRRFLTAILPVVREQWNTGEDFGLHQATIDEVVRELGLDSTVEAAFATLDDPEAARARLSNAFAVMVDGISLGDLVGGYGVARAAIDAAPKFGIEAQGATAVVQGFGSIGGAVARYLSQAGVKVIAIADRDGLLSDPDGLDVEALLAARNTFGVVDRATLPASVRQSDRDDWLGLECDILVPAAMSYVIQPADADRVHARIVVEGANMPTLPEAEASLLKRGIPVVPDFLANVMTNAWWWWNVFGDIEPTAESAFAKIDRVMARLIDRVVADAVDGVTLRDAAQALANANAAALQERFGS